MFYWLIVRFIKSWVIDLNWLLKCWSSFYFLKCQRCLKKLNEFFSSDFSYRLSGMRLESACTVLTNGSWVRWITQKREILMHVKRVFFHGKITVKYCLKLRDWDRNTMIQRSEDRKLEVKQKKMEIKYVENISLKQIVATAVDFRESCKTLKNDILLLN